VSDKRPWHFILVGGPFDGEFREVEEEYICARIWICHTFGSPRAAECYEHVEIYKDIRVVYSEYRKNWPRL
jgi:hypothetical protein